MSPTHLESGRVVCKDGYFTLDGETHYQVICQAERWTPKWVLPNGADMPRCFKVD